MGILGSIASLFRTKSGAKSSDYRPQGTGGAQQIGDRLVSKEKNSALSSPVARQKKFDDIKYNCHVVATGLRYFASLISSVDWNVTACKDEKGPNGEMKASKKSQQYADWIQKSFRYMDQPWYRVVRTASQFKWDGASVQEMVARRMPEVADGFIGIGSCEKRPLETLEEWYLEEQSNYVLGWMQRDPLTNEEYDLDRARCVYLHDDTLSSSPDGVGLLRHVVELVDQLRRLEQLELWAYETDLRGVPVGYAPTGLLDELVSTNRMTREDADRKLDGIQDFITNHVRNPSLGLLLDSRTYTGRDASQTPSSQKMWSLELMKGQGVGLAEIHQAIERKCHEIARVLGIEQFMLGSASKGSLALSEDKTRNLLELINATLAEVAWALERDFVGRIFDLNRWDRALMPELTPNAVALRSISVIVEVLSKLALAGATIDRNDPVINQIRKMLSLVDQPFVTEEMKMETKAPNSGGTPGKKAPNKPTPTKEQSAELAEIRRILGLLEEKLSTLEAA